MPMILLPLAISRPFFESSLCEPCQLLGRVQLGHQSSCCTHVILRPQTLPHVLHICITAPGSSAGSAVWQLQGSA